MDTDKETAEGNCHTLPKRGPRFCGTPLPPVGYNRAHRDVDLTLGLVTMRDTKFYKSRLAPVGPDRRFEQYACGRRHQARFGAMDQTFCAGISSYGSQLRRHTQHSYRDALRLFVIFASGTRHKKPDELLVDLGADLVRRFMCHIEEKQASSIATRNHD